MNFSLYLSIEPFPYLLSPLTSDLSPMAHTDWSIRGQGETILHNMSPLLNIFSKKLDENFWNNSGKIIDGSISVPAETTERDYFRCTFEGASVCGMSADPHWRVWNMTTPSELTGPDSANHGSTWFIYMEATDVSDGGSQRLV